MLSPYAVATDLELRPLDQEHASALYAIIERDRAYLRRWQNWPDFLQSLDVMRALIDRLTEKRERNDGFDLVIFSRGQPVGKIGLVYINWAIRRTEIGYWLAEDAQGRGLVTRACRALVDYVFDVLELDSIQIRCAAENFPSRAIPKRLGFGFDGLLPHKVWIHGVEYSEVTYTLTFKRWHMQFGQGA
jgi:ribosomal-protein-serine acetyltransferase